MSNRVSKTEWIANAKAEKKTLEVKLESFIKEALNSKVDMDALMAHYRISGLYGYSLKNSILIKIQGGTIAQSFAKWKKLERCVNKGEKGKIKVFVPMFKKDVDPMTGKKEETLVGFKLMPVFDIKQTSGKELTYDHNSTENTTVSYEDVKTVLEGLAGVKAIETYTGTARGWSDGKVMAVSSMSNDVDKIKTLVHEYAHHVLHTAKDMEKSKLSREGKEVEAESVAHLVCSYLGLDYELSAGYVQGYKAGIKEMRSGKVVFQADKVIKALKG
jgi:antirestriction protein ArdC